MAKVKKQKEEILVEETVNLAPLPDILDTEKIENIQDEPEVNNKPVMEEKLVVIPSLPQPTYRKELDTALSFEERIIAFIESRNTNSYVRLNDFLKSLYGVPRLGEPAKYLNKGEAKRMGVLLEDMRRKGLIAINGNTHQKLGTQYYEGQQQYSRHHNITTVIVEAKN